MGLIHLLPPHEALKIAAGEVIERPAHVLKELLENSLDAGATTIDIFIEDFGKCLIRVADNGSGMSAEDAEFCFVSHATSKLHHLDDLEHVASYGFRGEALASIAAISKVTLTTKLQSAAADDLGIAIEYSGVEVQKRSQASCGCGTDISVRDLFFNTPVRKKFLKRDETEWNALQTILHAVCLSHPGVHFKLYRDGMCVLNAPGVAHERERALALWDSDVAKNLLPMHPLADDAKISINGSISSPQIWRYGRHYINFFVNGRWVRNSELSKALLKGYAGVLPDKCFPAAAVFITLDRSQVDVNVHPKKEEVRFVQPGVVQAMLTSAVKKTLEQRITQALAPMPSRFTPIVTAASMSAPPLHDAMPYFAQVRYQSAPVVQNQVNVAMPIVHDQAKIEQSTEKRLIIGQLFATYIVVEKDDAVVIIDQHAAHERVIYEKIKKNYDIQHGIDLLFPELITLDADMIGEMLKHKDFFTRQGIAFDVIGDEKIVVRSAPPQLRGDSLASFIQDVAVFIGEHATLQHDLFAQTFNEYIHAQISCKSAIKAGDVLSHEQMVKLLDDLEAVDNRFICVHGRPTMWCIEKNEFEKKFRRT
ncbi:MAG: DNA mismatch repair endonuclease MutL [Candidatus Babeliales bacterium]|jgi:DNA mismatch repair protein MutL